MSGNHGGGIFLLEDDEGLRTVLVDLIKRTTSRECVGLATLADLREQRVFVLGCELGVIDVNLGPNQPSGLDAFAWLRAERFGGRVVFLTGHAKSHPLVDRAVHMGDALVLSKPLEFARLMELLHKPKG